MINPADNQNSQATTAFSTPNLPSDYFEAAKRARGEVLRGMILALFKWARSGAADQPSHDAASTAPGSARSLEESTMVALLGALLFAAFVLAQLMAVVAVHAERERRQPHGGD